MIRKSSRSPETLVLEDGVVAAKTLPLDRATSEIAFETATFGIG